MKAANNLKALNKVKANQMDKSQIGLAGEFYVLAQLSQRGYIATLTLGNTKGVDIIVAKPNSNIFFKVEVKTSTGKLRKESLFGDELLYSWAMSEKHERLKDDSLVYCFVVLHSPSELPKFFLVPCKDVADYVEWQHKHWLSTRKSAVKSTALRNFRILSSDPKGYQDNWEIFGR